MLKPINYNVDVKSILMLHVYVAVLFYMLRKTIFLNIMQVIMHYSSDDKLI